MPPGPEKRRRRKARILDQDSSDSSSAEESAGANSGSEAGDHSEPSELSGLSDAASDAESAASEDEEEPRERLRKLPSNQTAAQFNQTFLELVTQQFGDELAQLREANDFGPASLSQLVAGLKQGIDIFDPEQQKLL